ncbi:hypothetical protein OSTOST_24415, partial [Ostertagia ostertagi]
MLLITALLFFSLLDVSAQTSQVESLTELMKDPIDVLLEEEIGDLDENKEQALLELLLRILGENEDKVRGIKSGSHYGCGSLYKEMDEDHST